MCVEVLADFYTLSPTQSLLQKWLREKHKIHISIYPIKNYWQMDLRCCDLEKLCHISFVDCNNEFKTYEEALEQGLKETLTLIKNGK